MKFIKAHKVATLVIAILVIILGWIVFRSVELYNLRVENARMSGTEVMK